MLSNIKLTGKMLLGFSSLIVLALILGITGWYGVSQLAGTYAKATHGNACLEAVNQTGNQRREFAMHGFAQLDGQSKNAAEIWEEKYAEMMRELENLSNLSGLKNEYRQRANEVKHSSEKYREVFQDQKAAQKLKDEAFANWGKIGWAVTNEINEVLDKQITPALAKAKKSQNAQKLAYWSHVGEGIHTNVVEPFLLLRVTAVYLLATDGDKQWEAFRNQLQKAKNGLSRWTSKVAGDRLLSSVAAHIANHLKNYEKAGNDYWHGVQAKRTSDQQMAQEARAIVAGIHDIDSGLEQDMHSIAAGSTLTMIIISVAGIVLGVVLMILITGSIVGPIKKIILSLTSGSNQVSSASEQLSSSSQQLSEGASEQASSLEEISSSLEEMASMTRQNSDNTVQADSLVKDSNELVGQGKAAMERMNTAINEIKNSSDETAKIIKTIDEIAMQTNLLALNAAVEAARAGEAGRGFAVVAEEVRSLAQRSAEAAKVTSELIANSQGNAERGVGLAEEAHGSIISIAESSTRISSLISEITAASKEQAQGIDQVNTAVAQMDKVTQSNAANAEESASAGEELSGQAQQLNAIVSELENMVGAGTQNGARNSLSRNSVSRSKALRSPARPQRRVAQQPSPADVRQMSPQQVLPLDDKDLQDF
ncbi:MAG: hypothetical protein GF398_14600 [Chitinivibrionales bacterium]|nr:hypothetical protein [Chitinivibrionales bacterium]